MIMEETRFHFVPDFVVAFVLTNFVDFIVGPSDASAGKPTELAPQKIGRAPKAPSSKVPSSYTAAVSSDTAPRTAPGQGMLSLLVSIKSCECNFYRFHVDGQSFELTCYIISVSFFLLKLFLGSENYMIL